MLVSEGGGLRFGIRDRDLGIPQRRVARDSICSIDVVAILSFVSADVCEFYYFP